MPQVVTEIELIVPLYETPTRVKDQWAIGLKGAAEALNEKRKLRLGTEEDFDQRLASPSNQAYSPVLNSTFVSRSGASKTMIVDSQRSNLKRSFKKYNDQLDYQFATVDDIPAKRFKELVDRGKDDFADGVAARTLRITGSRAESLGIAGIVPLWLTNDPTVESYLRGGDEVKAGGPYLITSAAKRAAFKAMLAGQLVFVGIQIIKSELDPTIMSTLNQLLAEQVQGFVDPSLDLQPFVAGGSSHIDYVNDAVKGLILSVKATKM